MTRKFKVGDILDEIASPSRRPLGALLSNTDDVRSNREPTNRTHPISMRSAVSETERTVIAVAREIQRTEQKIKTAGETTQLRLRLAGLREDLAFFEAELTVYLSKRNRIQPKGFRNARIYKGE